MAKGFKDKLIAARKAKSNRRSLRKSILIFCEGEETERNYFGGFNRVYPYFINKQNLELVKEAIIRKQQEELKRGASFDQIWCVIDVDGKDPEVIKKACRLGEENKIKVVYSNRAIELWFILHFKIYNTPSMSIKQYEDELAKLFLKHFKVKYNKADRLIYNRLKPLLKNALKNAKILMNANPNGDPAADPSLTVYKLVEELLKVSED